MATRIELIQQMPIFGAISAETIHFLLDDAPRIEKSAGSFFFREGEPAEFMYVIESGRVTVCKNWQGHELRLRRLAEGDCFGEMALLDLFPRSASVRADTECRAVRLAPDDLHRLFERDPEQFALFQMNIAREMSRRLRETDSQLFRARMGEALTAPEPIGSPDAP